MKYKDTTLWQRARNQAEANECLDAWQRLETEYDKFWSNANSLADKISSELQGLTLHNHAHLEAVWDVADLIAGEDFPMTPLEVFVFGGAVLLHDLGHTVTAYDGGIDAVRKTSAWRQAVLWRLDLDDDAPNPPDKEIEQPEREIEWAALFDTLRALHAEQAEKLHKTPYAGPDGQMFLIEDSDIRDELGELIGLIAASHHWDRETLRQKLGDEAAGISFGLKLGQIQPVKLACLLRCADACQIDRRRAGNFDYAVQRPVGISKLHWDAQNRLKPPFVSKDQSLVFQSTRPFAEDEADTWWVAHNLIQVAHRELQECDALLRDQGLPPLRVKAVAGASDPAELAETHVKAAGWKPVDASIRVSDPRRIVEMFGGEQYYGEDALWVPIRELLQNGIDAIEAKRLLVDGYEGRILVEQVADTLDGKDGYWLHVSDDGVGMSERVLTRTLVDFGRSAKASGELTEEFEGLRGKRVRTIGQFGIGFFSVLMLSDHILVQSKPYNRGDEATKKLRFVWGGESRPLLLDGNLDELYGMSTKVSLFVEKERFDRLMGCLATERYIAGNWQTFEVRSFTKLIQMVAPLPNCRIDVLEAAGEVKLARRPADYTEPNQLDWLKSLDAQESTEALERASRFLTPLWDLAGKMAGLATFNFDITSENEHGRQTEKGLCVKAKGRSGLFVSREIIGVLPTVASEPSRSQGSGPEGEAFEAWRATQLDTLLPADFSFEERHKLAANIHSLSGDPIKFATIAVASCENGQMVRSWYEIDKFVDLQDRFFELEKSLNISEAEQAKDILNENWNKISIDPFWLLINDELFNRLWSNRFFVFLPNVIVNMFREDSYLTQDEYEKAKCDDESCLLGCLRRHCKDCSLDAIITHTDHVFLGIERDFQTGKFVEVYADDVPQLRIRPAP